MVQIKCIETERERRARPKDRACLMFWGDWGGNIYETVDYLDPMEDQLDVGKLGPDTGKNTWVRLLIRHFSEMWEILGSITKVSYILVA